MKQTRLRSIIRHLEEALNSGQTQAAEQLALKLKAIAKKKDNLADQERVELNYMANQLLTRSKISLADTVEFLYKFWNYPDITAILIDLDEYTELEKLYNRCVFNRES